MPRLRASRLRCALAGSCDARVGTHPEPGYCEQALGDGVVRGDGVSAVGLAPGQGAGHHSRRLVHVQVPGAQEPGGGGQARGRGGGQGTGRGWRPVSAGAAGQGTRGAQGKQCAGLPAGRALGQDVGAGLVLRVQQLRAPQHRPLRQAGGQAGAQLRHQGQALVRILFRVQRHQAEVPRHGGLLGHLSRPGAGRSVSGAVRHG